VFFLWSVYSHTLFEKATAGEDISTRWLHLKEINHSRDSWLVEAYKPACHAYSAIVDSFVIGSFFSWETLYSAVLSFTNILRLCQIIPMVWSRWLLFWVW